MSEHITAYADDLSTSKSRLLSQGFFRRAFLSRIDGITGGAIKLHEAELGVQTLGQADGGETIDVYIHDQAFYKHACLGGDIGLGEAYMLGLWHCDDLVGLVQLFIDNLEQLDAMSGGLAQIQRPLLRFLDWRRRNHKDNARLNIAAHYDLGNDFFKLFLDDSMMYSAALYDAEHPTLEQAQWNKLDTLCRKLELKPGEHLVEIGTGWGAMAIHAARHYGVNVTTTTISKEQYDLATARVQDAGLEQQITVLLSDYRDLEGQYDKLVSIEMIEAVGHDYLGDYLKVCERLLKPGGQALIQAITCIDQRYDLYRKTPDFIRRYIFPGGHLPSVTQLTSLATKHTQLRMTHLQDYAQDYAQTLHDWRERFWSQEDAIRDLGYSDMFMRMWDFYLAICEAGFTKRHIGLAHIMFTATNHAESH